MITAQIQLVGIVVRDGSTLDAIFLSIFYIYLWEHVEGTPCIFEFFAYFYLFFYILHKMFGVPGSVATSIWGKDTMEPRLHSLCVTAGLSEDLMNKMWDNGLVSASIMSNTFENWANCAAFSSSSRLICRVRTNRPSSSWGR